MCGAVCAHAQTDEVVGAQAGPIQIMGAEAESIIQTINGHVQGAMHRGYIVLFDRKKGEQVTLRLDRIVLDDPARVFFPGPDQVAVCGECSQVELESELGHETQVREMGDKYEVWFVVQRGVPFSRRSRVLDTLIKSVNGNPMFSWAQDADGQWSATLAPDAP